MPINTNTNSRTERVACISSLVQQIQKAARKYELGRIYTQTDDKLHRSHKGCGFFKPGTLTKIVEDLKGDFSWINFNIIDKVYIKHAQSFANLHKISNLMLHL